MDQSERHMPHWVQILPASELHWLLADLKAAESLRTALPSASRDGRLIDATIGHFNGRLGVLVEWDCVDDPAATLTSRTGAARVGETSYKGVPSVVCRLTDWRDADRVIETADKA